MSQDEQQVSLWRIWRHERLASLTHPFGWSSLTAQYWLHEGDTRHTCDLLPGTWSFINSEITHTPDPKHPNHSPIVINGIPLTSPRALAPLGTLIAGAPVSRVAFSGDREVEVMMRSTSQGDKMAAIRVRDPHHAASAHTLTLPTFEYSNEYRAQAQFVPHSPVDVVRETIAANIIDIAQSIGTLHFTLMGEDHQLIVFGQHVGGQMHAFTHLRDATSGSLSHENGRRIDLSMSGDGEITEVDFNYLHSMPCAVTDFVSCPIPIAENRLDVAILAGEQTPLLAGR